MRLPGAALLIMIGLVVLWVAATGKLDQLANAWTVLSGKATATAANGANPQAASCDPSKGICDYSNFHVANVLNTIGGGASVTNPGGMI